MASVRAWAGARGYDYRVEDDALFDRLPPWVVAKTEGRGAVRADLARLLWIRAALAEGRWHRVAWLDADVIVVAPDLLTLSTETTHAFGREAWVTPGRGGEGLRVRRHVHNAVCVFGPDDPVLPFLIHVAEGLMRRVAPGRHPPQFLGPKLLSHLHGVADFPLIESVGMASPLVLRDLASTTGDGSALARLRAAHGAPLAALNLCASLVGHTADGVTITDSLVNTVLDRLAARGRV